MKMKNIIMLMMLFAIFIIPNVNAVETTVYYQDFENGTATEYFLDGGVSVSSDNVIDGTYSLFDDASGGGYSFVNANPIFNLTTSPIANITFLYRYYDYNQLGNGVMYIGGSTYNSFGFSNGFVIVIGNNTYLQTGYNTVYVNNNNPYFFTNDSTWRITFIVNDTSNTVKLYINDTYITFTSPSGDIEFEGDTSNLNSFGFINGNSGTAGAVFDNIRVIQDITPPVNNYLSVDFITPTPNNNTVTNDTFVNVFVNTTTNNLPLSCSLNFNSVYYSMTNTTDFEFNYNVTTLLNGTYEYNVNCSNAFNTNITSSRFITINQSENACVENWVQNNTQCNGFNYTIQYYDSNSCGTNFTEPTNNGEVVDCSPLNISGAITKANTGFMNIFVVMVMFAVIAGLIILFNKDVLTNKTFVSVLIVGFVVLAIIMLVIALSTFNLLI